MESIEDLKKQQEEIKKKLNLLIKAEQQVLEDSLEIKVGDIVEGTRFITDRDNYYIGDEWFCEKVYNIHKDSDNKIYIEFYGHTPRQAIEDVKLFKKDDYTLRHSLWDRDLDVGDDFQLFVEKPNCTKGNLYYIKKLVKVYKEDASYWFQNDQFELEEIQDGEYHFIYPKD